MAGRGNWRRFFYAIKYFLPAQFGEPYGTAWQPIFSVFAYAALGACLIGALVGLARRLRDYRIYKRQESIETIRSLDWLDFERMATEAFRQQGYRAQRSKSGPDGGVDIVLERSSKTTLVQCKQWKSFRVGVKPIRELAGVVAAHKADNGIFVCAGKYTAEAKAFAEKSGIELVDGEGLVRLMALTESEPESEAQTAATATQSCPRCSSELVRRVARRGKDAGSEFIGCSAFPKCRYTRNV